MAGKSDDKKKAVCSFCGRPEDKFRKLFVGHNVMNVLVFAVRLSRKRHMIRLRQTLQKLTCSNQRKLKNF